MHLVGDNPEWLSEDGCQDRGVAVPMFQAEAVGLYFSKSYPFSTKVAADKVNAITGEPWTNLSRSGRYYYSVTSLANFLDGFNVAKERVHQFVFMPLGGRLTIEERLTGLADQGALQLHFNPIKVEFFHDLYRAPPNSDDKDFYKEHHLMQDSITDSAQPEMGLAPGGLVRQRTPTDKYGYDGWDQVPGGLCFSPLLNSRQQPEVVGDKQPDSLS